MPKLEMDPPFRHLRGRIGGLVYRKNENGTTVAKARASDAPLSAAQLAVQERFTAAAAYARLAIADPVLGPRYAAAAKELEMKPFGLAVADFFDAPVVNGIDASGWHGAIGETIKVDASDKFEVAGVTLTIRSAANAVLEQGPAVFAGGAWRYTATTVVPAGTEVAIEAVATDRPGNTGTRVVTLIVA